MMTKKPPSSANPKSDKENAGMRAVERVTAILQSFSMTRPMLSLTEVARATGLDKNTTRRLLIALCRTGLVRRDETEGTYGLDIGVLKLQPAVLGPRALRETAAPHLQWLAEKTGMTSFFWIPDSEGAICIDRVRASGVFLDVPWSSPGTVVPLNMAAGPRVILAHISEEARASWLARSQPQFTQFSQTDQSELLRSIERIRLHGYEVVRNDYYVGMAGLGVPALNRGGTFVGAISVTSGSSDFDDPARMQSALAAARETAAAIGLRLGPGLATTG
ncbi:IclR family transcriptional regulator [Pseudochelatococcus contaminans]|uniref:DNA-binding IclR family transcriptional regulator n=1 Tax=Pseudochelatococcus contaminans TaxID=1538103 RepID=A0A7W6EE73_9HYPH|nr:IclR family transcriptional regulator [Pseudochelatococcus contaminans]MBB3808056.1 DNA-binding IclR family transcriptional regulator [Pseudochelatococcus contaminans]